MSQARWDDKAVAWTHFAFLIAQSKSKAAAFDVGGLHVRMVM